MTRPGENIRSIASRLLRSETMERVVDPIVADLQCEYDQALEGGTLLSARLSLIRSYLGLGRALVWLGMRYVGDPRTSNPGSDVARTWMVSVLALAILTGALVIPPLLSWPWWQEDPVFGALLSVTLVPQALPLSIPAGLCLGVLWATRGKVVTWRRLCTILALAMAFTAIVWIVLEWMMPQGNHVFREMVARRLAVDGHVLTLEPGLNELGLSRLGQRSDPAAVRHYHVLWALCFAGVPLSLFALGLARYVRRAATAVALAMTLSFSYFACMSVFDALSSAPPMPPSVQAWMPNMMLLLLACALLLRGPRRGAT
jgi:hypothetical protein